MFSNLLLRRSTQMLLAIALVSLLVACSGTPSASTIDEAGESPVAEQVTPAPTDVPGAVEPSPLAEMPQLKGKATVALTINGQEITLEVDGDRAPITAGNFIDLVQRGVYDGTTFHRVEPGFVAQGGDPLSKDAQTPEAQLGTGSFIDPQTNAPRYIPLEILPEGAEQPVYGKTLESAGVKAPPVLKHGQGALAMARSMLPDSASSQFYITLADADFLNGNYAAFGSVIEGMDVVAGIQKGDRIESMKVLTGIENLQNGGT